MVDDLYSEKEKYFDYRDQLHRITAKTLAVVGDKDWICPPSRLYIDHADELRGRDIRLTFSYAENSEFIVSKIPNAKLFVVENANHSVHLEKNELVISRIRDHLKS